MKISTFDVADGDRGDALGAVAEDDDRVVPALIGPMIGVERRASFAASESRRIDRQVEVDVDAGLGVERGSA